MDFFMWSTIVLAVWAALGPLVGVRYGQELAKRWQKEQWIKENARQECRELITVMADTFSVYLKCFGPSNIPGPPSSGEILEQERALKDSLEIFYSRLFISDQLLKLKIRDRWIAALSGYEKSKDAKKFTNDYGTLIAEVRNIAQNFIA